MKHLSNNDIQMVSGGVYSRESYDFNTGMWGFIGMCTAAASLSLIPTPYGQYFAARLAYVGAGSLAGYVFGAVEYHVSEAVRSGVDYYLAPEA